ncbi:zinc finger protein 271-like isoform X2 [Toxorhynchites rutilus septentrionalis]|uniref:zinc finger protein 271-like isoform X2 n=1 Tax=Toxorhynchites rutilus septentrionalis TaxID=329112 RepID=UPI002478AB71|nr:zinc finger protein 271-like isoform X2 [Toxorhynchites rutilus septentrionalis]
MEVMDMNLEYDLAKICRSCRQDGKILHSIFHTIGNGGITLHEMITSCTQMQIHYNDGMPHNMCTACVSDINTAYDFRKRYEQSDMMLREYISRRKVEADGNEGTAGGMVKLELFDIKPEITFVEPDPLIGEKCYPNSRQPIIIQQGGNSQIEFEGTDSLIQLDDGIIEEIDEDGVLVPERDEMCVEFVDNSDDEELVDGDEIQSDEEAEEFDFEEGSLDDLIEEIRPEKRRTRMRKNKDYSKTKGGKFACNSCERIFADKRGITNHVKQHEPKELKVCTVCNRGFITSYHLTRHMKIHENDIQCEHCEKQYSALAYNEYREHMAVEHPGMALLPQKSDKSDRDLALTLTAEMIEDKGKMEAICRICDSTFERIVKLRSHLKTHVDPKSYDNANIHTKPYLFEEGYVLENYLEYLVQQICKWDVLRFYQIVEPDGEELELSDSDSEIEDDGTPVDEIVRRTHTCALCNLSFSRIKSIMEHARDQHRPEDLLGCNHCARGFPNTALLVRHLKQQCENQHKKFFCTFCNEKFMWQTSLNRHAQRKHKPTKPLWEKPEVPSEGDDRDKKFVCQVCNKGFLRLEHLDRHIKIHIPSEKKFECTQCHKKFNRKDNLRSHMKIHKKDPEMVNKQNHLCVYCGRGFSNSSNLIVHMRRHTGERPYKCDICDKGFPRSSDLQCHRRTHTGEKPCLCTICGKGFSRSNKLVRHMRIHTGTRPYSCTYCDRAFTQSNDLTLHIRRHTGEKPYMCGICNERFIQGTALKAHQRITGHFDDGSSQPERFASISVNNPNRLGINGPKAVRQNSSANADGVPKAVKPVKSRKKATPAASRLTQASQIANTEVPHQQQSPPSAPPAAVSSGSAANSAPPSPDDSSSPTGRLSLHSLTGPPHGYVPVPPYIMQNYDLASTGLFSQSFGPQ